MTTRALSLFISSNVPRLIIVLIGAAEKTRARNSSCSRSDVETAVALDPGAGFGAFNSDGETVGVGLHFSPVSVYKVYIFFY